METPRLKRLFELSGKTAIVTGATGILGRRFCAGLASFGANVAIVDLDSEVVNDYAAQLEKEYRVKCVGINCDVSRPDDVASMVKQVVSEFGEVHVLHNNAATKTSNLDAFFATVEDYSFEQWRRVMSVNIDGMFLVAQRVGAQMVRQGKGGSIIQTASIYGILAPDSRIYQGSDYGGRPISTPAVYSVSKAAVIGLTRHLAAYWAPHRIRVNALTPGGVESGQNEIFKERYSSRVPMQRMAAAEELVGAVVYLASDASTYVTGQNLVVDGGLSIW